jgi:hypothetical protein
VKALIAALVLLLAACSRAASYTTQTWHSKIEVGKDQTLLVTEEIGVTFTMPQHGLIRRIPLTNRTGHYVDYSMVKAEVRPGENGAFEDARFRASTEGSDWIVKIGRGDTNVSGQVSYRLTYKVFGAINTFGATDPLGPHRELNFNAIPTGWATVIEHGSIEVSTPKPEPGKYKARLLAGPERSRWGLELSLDDPPVGDAKLIHASLVPGLFKAEITRAIPKGYGATVVLAMPGGTLDAVVPQPTSAEESYSSNNQPLFLASEVREWLIGGALPLAVLPFLLLVALALKPRPGPMVVQFEPPPGVEASSSGLLLDSRVDQHDIVAGILQVALKGGFRIDPDESGMTIEVLPDNKATHLSQFEKEVHRSIGMFGTTVSAQSLRGSFGTYFALLRASLTQDAIKRGWYGKSSPTKLWLTWVFVLVTLGLGFYGMTLSPCLAPVGIVISLVVGLLSLNKILVWSQAGVDTRNKVLGLREFIMKAQEPELDYMSRITPSQALFENLLPYAVAFGAIKQWSQAFAGINLTQPSWYAGSDGGVDFNSVMLGNLLYDIDDTWGRSIATPDPIVHSTGSSGDSSGFGGGFSGSSDSGGSWDSGGGFSGGGDTGGGSGGGGGDSW